MKPDNLYPFSPSLAAYVHAAFVLTSYRPLFLCKPVRKRKRNKLTAAFTTQHRTEWNRNSKQNLNPGCKNRPANRANTHYTTRNKRKDFIKDKGNWDLHSTTNIFVPTALQRYQALTSVGTYNVHKHIQCIKVPMRANLE